MKNLNKTTLLLLMVLFFSACTIPTINQRKFEMNTQNNYAATKKMFNERN
ncbi:MAG: hypothetical protein Q7U04_16940 [Bacteriovorax sp.]|nr:hypothetical protein [Bacteriovorax sp.]